MHSAYTVCLCVVRTQCAYVLCLHSVLMCYALYLQCAYVVCLCGVLTQCAYALHLHSVVLTQWASFLHLQRVLVWCDYIL